MEGSHAIDVEHVWKTYRPRHAAPTEALRGVSLKVEVGETVAVVGPSGSGKSTLLAILGALETADDGRVEVLGQDLRRLRGARAADFRFRRVGFVFQQYYLLPGLTVLENLLAPYIGRRRPAEAPQRALTLLERVGLAARRNALPHELSGGEQQRVCIARTLMTQPDLLLADEPTGNLDSATGDAIMDLVLDLVHEGGRTLILVTHNDAMARRMDRIVELRDGRIVA